MGIACALVAALSVTCDLFPELKVDDFSGTPVNGALPMGEECAVAWLGGTEPVSWVGCGQAEIKKKKIEGD